MKKDRNSFFSQYGYSSFNTNNMMPGNMNMPMQPYMNVPQNQNYVESDLESRISKLERENKVLEARISNLENNIPKITNNTDYNFANSMYMV